MISRRPREITAPIDENIIVAERHVARGRWTTAELPFTIVRRRRVQRGVQHYDTTVADLQQTKEEEEEEENQLWKFMKRCEVDFRRPSFRAILSSRLLFHEIFSPPRRKYPFSLRRKKISTTRFRKPAPLHGGYKVDFCLYEHSRPRALRLRCNLHANQTCPRRHRPIPRCSPEIKDCLENIGMCIWKAKRKGVILYNYLIETTNLELFVYYNSFANSHLELCIVLLI